MNRLQKEYSLSEKQIKLLDTYMNTVIETNKLFNLTSITDKEEFITKHIEDSLLLLKHIDWNYKKVMDIGTGAGIPGVILAIAKPETEFILVDSTEKKINFINNFCEENGITNLKAVVSRAEELQEEVDMLTSRAVAALPKLLEISSHLVKVGGDIILYKGKNLEEEMCPKLEGEIEELGLKFDFIKRYELKENERTIIKYNKVKENKKGYPRTWKEIKNKDLCK